MPDAHRKTPVWFWMVAILLTLWGIVGCYACYLQFMLGAEAMGPATEYDRALHAGLPAWYNYCYALAVGAGLAGGIGLLLRAHWAGIAFLVSLIAAIVQFGYLFIATDIILVKGAATVLPFPILIIAVAGASMWFAVHAYRQGWTG
jgi:hypothetical protein